jgi:hypothetical protein
MMRDYMKMKIYKKLMLTMIFPTIILMFVCLGCDPSQLDYYRLAKDPNVKKYYLEILLSPKRRSQYSIHYVKNCNPSIETFEANISLLKYERIDGTYVLVNLDEIVVITCSESD